MGSGGLLIEAEAGAGVTNNRDGDPNGRPGRVVAGDLEISVRAPRCDLRKLLWDLQWSGRAQPGGPAASQSRVHTA